jgi:mycothiol synthase
MQIISHGFTGENDLRAMEALARQTRPDNLHVTDLPWRFTSWAMENPERIRLWFDESGRLVAWLVLQVSFESWDFICLPEFESQLLPQMLSWADKSSRGHNDIVPLGTPEGNPCWFVNVFSDQTDRILMLETAGFASQADVGEYSWTKVFMQRLGDLPVKEYRIPKEFTIRAIAGEIEVDAYVQLHLETFRSKNMTADWRRRVIQHPDHISDLDLVAVAPDGRLGAFCVCWLDDRSPEPIGQIEPLGCHPDYRSFGLGRLTLCEGLRRLQLHGARKVFVETDNWRNTAFQLYESVGFQVQRDVLVYRKDY